MFLNTAVVMLHNFIQRCKTSIVHIGCRQFDKALGIVYRTIATWLIKQAGFTHDTARTGAVTFIQRFGSALNLNVHLTCMDALMSRAHGCAGATHMLFLDGVYFTGFEKEKQLFKRVNAPVKTNLEAVLQQLSTRLARMLEKEGVLTQDAENSVWR